MKIRNKILIGLLSLIGCLSLTMIKPQAYSFNEEQNLQSDNLFDPQQLYSSNNANYVSFNIDFDNMHILLTNENINADSYYYVYNVVTLEEGSYTFTFNSNYNIQYIGFTTYNTTNFIPIYRLANIDSGSFIMEVNSTITFGFGFELLNYTNYDITIMLNKGVSSISYEPYGWIYKSPNNVNKEILEIYDNFYSSNINELIDYSNIKLYRSNDNMVTWSLVENSSNGFVSLQYDENNFLTAHFGNMSIDYVYKMVVSLNASYSMYSLYFQNSSVDGYFFNNKDYRYLIEENINGFNGVLIPESVIKVYNFGFVVDTPSSSYDVNFNAYVLLNQNSTAYDKGYQQAIKEKQKDIQALKEQIKVLQETFDNGGWQGFALSLADTPLRVVQNMLGFEVFGINLYIALTGIITLLAILFIIKKLWK